MCGWDWPIYAKTKQVCIEVWSRCFCCCCCESCDFVIWFVRFLYCLWFFFFFFFMSNLEVWKILVCLWKLQRNTAGLALLHTQIATERKIERERESEREISRLLICASTSATVQPKSTCHDKLLNCLLIFFFFFGGGAGGGAYFWYLYCVWFFFLIKFTAFDFITLNLTIMCNVTVSFIL